MAVLAKHLIDGEFVGEASSETRVSPGTGEVAAVLPQVDVALADAAITAASEAWPKWAAIGPVARGKILARAAELLSARVETVASQLTCEEGKTINEARGEVNRAADILRFFGGLGWLPAGDVLPSATPQTHLYSQREPLGVVGLITPWNFPIAIPTWKAAPALLAGNTVVIKPAELTPLSATALGEVLVEAGVPAGVFNIVHGSGKTIGAPLVADKRLAAVSFTGSGPVGRTIAETAAAHGARVQLELGGKNAMVVLDDADPSFAAKIVAASAFGLTGQACTATSRVICTSGIYERVRDALAIESEEWLPGDPQNERTRMGPVVDHSQLEIDVRYLEQAVAEGANIVSGGEVDGLRFSPVVLSDVVPGAVVAREEIFGPVVSLLHAYGFDHATELVNDSTYGLTAGVITNDIASAMRFANSVQVGVVKVNRPTTGLDLNAPFGGMKGSSNGMFREQGLEAMSFYSRTKTIYLGW